MSELSESPVDLFKKNIDKVIYTFINGVEIPVLELSDSRGDYLAIPALEQYKKPLSNIILTTILDKYIIEVSQYPCTGKPTIIKAYYKHNF